MPDLFVAKKDESNSTPPPKEETIPEDEGKQDTSPKPEVPSVPAPLREFNEAITKHMRAISTFSQFPNNIRFENQEDDEFIILFMRRHFITNFIWVLLTFLFSFVPLLVSWLVLPVLEAVGIIIPVNYLFVLLLFYYLIIFGYAYVHFVSWFFNIGIITNLRVVDIDVIDITSKNVAATEIEDLIDVEYNQQGFLQNFFDYGHLHIQIEGLKPNFEFLSVPHPAKAADIVSDLMREVKHD